MGKLCQFSNRLGLSIVIKTYKCYLDILDENRHNLQESTQTLFKSIGGRLTVFIRPGTISRKPGRTLPHHRLATFVIN